MHGGVRIAQVSASVQAGSLHMQAATHPKEHAMQLTLTTLTRLLPMLMLMLVLLVLLVLLPLAGCGGGGDDAPDVANTVMPVNFHSTLLVCR